MWGGGGVGGFPGEKTRTFWFFFYLLFGSHISPSSHNPLPVLETEKKRKPSVEKSLVRSLCQAIFANSLPSPFFFFGVETLVYCTCKSHLPGALFAIWEKKTLKRSHFLHTMAFLYKTTNQHVCLYTEDFFSFFKISQTSQISLFLVTYYY